MSLHRQLFMVLRDEISRGMYSGGMLPKDETLCERFGVSRITVRRALGDLAALGVVERRHGLGTFVRADASLARTRPSLNLIDSLRDSVMHTNVEVLGVENTEAPPDVSTLLQLKPAERAIHALRLRSIGGTPVLLTDAWVPFDVGRHVTAAALRENALYEILLAQGVKFGRVVQELNAQLADPALAELLQTEVGGPILKLVRVLHDTEARPVQHLTAYAVPERSRILMDIPVDDINTLSAGQFVHDVPHAALPRRLVAGKRR